MDETYICSNPVRLKCVAGKGQKAHQNVQGSGKDNTSILACCSADGKVLPPLIIFTGQHLWTTRKGKHDIKGTFYASFDKGYMTSVIFQDWFIKLCSLVKERPLLLIFDGYLSHLDLTTLEKAREQHITILKLPPHTTETLQPLDKACFKPLKDMWNERLQEWQRLNMRKTSRSEMVDLLCGIWEESISQKTIPAGFNSTGIFACNREKYPKHRLDPGKLEKYYAMTIQTGHTNEVVSPTTTPLPVRESEPMAGPSNASEPGTLTITVSPVGKESLAGPSNISNRPPITIASLISKSQPLPGPSNTSDGPEPISSLEQNCGKSSVTFADLLLQVKKTTPIPETKQHSEVVTSEEDMTLIKNKCGKLKNGRPKPVGNRKTKLGKQKRNIPKDPETSEDEEWLESGDSLQDIDLLEDEPAEICEVIEPNEVKIGDYVLVQFKGGKRKTVIYKYVCVVQKTYPVTDEYDVMCMNMISGNKTLFKLNEADVSLIHKNDIIGILPVPFMSCTGQHMQYCFAQPVDVCEK